MNNSRCSTFYIALPTSAADKEYFSLIHHSGHLFSNSKEGEKYSTPFCCSMRLQVILECPIMVFLNLDFPSFPYPFSFFLKQGCMLSHFSRVWFFVTLWTVALQAPLSMGFSRQEYWSGSTYPPPGDLPHPQIELQSPAALQADSVSHCGRL